MISDSLFVEVIKRYMQMDTVGDEHKSLVHSCIDTNFRDWRDGPVIKSSYCSLSALEFAFQHPCPVTHSHLKL